MPAPPRTRKAAQTTPRATRAIERSPPRPATSRLEVASPPATAAHCARPGIRSVPATSRASRRRSRAGHAEPVSQAACSAASAASVPAAAGRASQTVRPTRLARSPSLTVVANHRPGLDPSHEARRALALRGPEQPAAPPSVRSGRPPSAPPSQTGTSRAHDEQMRPGRSGAPGLRSAVVD